MNILVLYVTHAQHTDSKHSSVETHAKQSDMNVLDSLVKVNDINLQCVRVCVLLSDVTLSNFSFLYKITSFDFPVFAQRSFQAHRQALTAQ